MKTPQLEPARILEIVEANNVPRDRYPVVMTAIRGYYLDSMGVPGRNDRRIYDDAMFLIWPDGIARFVGNTDPNGYRKGYGYGNKKGMACLKPGIHIFGTGTHRGRLAFRQCEVFTVIRDGDPPYEHKGYHAINLHDGGQWTTSSLGCQTMQPDRWRTFRPLAYKLLGQYGNEKAKNDWKQLVRSMPYVLIEENERRKGNLVVSQRYLA